VHVQAKLFSYPSTAVLAMKILPQIHLKDQQVDRDDNPILSSSDPNRNYRAVERLQGMGGMGISRLI